MIEEIEMTNAVKNDVLITFPGASAYPLALE